jgi:hypothetical protein
LAGALDRAMTGTRSVRDVLWDACRKKSCCRTTRVVLSGADLVRLTAAFQLPAAAIAVPAVVEPGTGGFLLRPEGQEHELVLRKNGPVSGAGAPCAFLVHTNDGHALCGAGSAKPGSCQAFPATLSQGRLRVIAHQCQCRRWSPLDLTQRERSLAAVAATEKEQHDNAVEEWNNLVRDHRLERSVDDFCQFLIARCSPDG